MDKIKNVLVQNQIHFQERKSGQYLFLDFWELEENIYLTDFVLTKISLDQSEKIYALEFETIHEGEHYPKKFQDEDVVTEVLVKILHLYKEMNDILTFANKASL